MRAVAGTIRQRWAAVLAALLACVALQAQTVGALPEHVRAVLSAAAAPEISPVGKYVGPGSCSAVACHGGIQPLMKTKVLQNEYSTWVTEDKHARAYTALTGSLGQQMARDPEDWRGGEGAEVPGVPCAELWMRRIGRASSMWRRV